MTDVRTMRSYLDLIAQRDLALGMATDLADALARAEDRARSAERPDPFHGHHPEHPTPQEAAQ